MFSYQHTNNGFHGKSSVANIEISIHICGISRYNSPQRLSNFIKSLYLTLVISLNCKLKVCMTTLAFACYYCRYYYIVTIEIFIF